MQASTKVDLSASEADNPAPFAAWKCSCKIVDGVTSRAFSMPIRPWTKSEMAVSGLVLVHRDPLAASTSWPASEAQMFSSPVRKNRFGSFASTACSAPRLYWSEGSTATMFCTDRGAVVPTRSPHGSGMARRFESAVQR